MSWFKVESSFRDHRKVKRLARELGCSLIEARGMLVGLLCSVNDQTPDGCLDGWKPWEIADAAGWEGDGPLFVQTLKDCGWLDDGDNGLEIHQFMDRAQGHREAQRAKKHRESKKLKPITAPSRDESRTNTVRVTGRGEERTERTERTGQTGEERTESIVIGSPKGSRKYTAEAGQVLSLYQQCNPTRGKGVKPGHPDFERIRARLTEGFSVGDLCRAVKGNLLDAWHVEKRKHSLEFVFRNRTKVEDFIDKAVNGSDIGRSSREIQNQLAGQAWLEESNGK